MDIRSTGHKFCCIKGVNFLLGVILPKVLHSLPDKVNERRRSTPLSAALLFVHSKEPSPTELLSWVLCFCHYFGAKPQAREAAGSPLTSGFYQLCTYCVYALTSGTMGRWVVRGGRGVRNVICNFEKSERTHNFPRGRRQTIRRVSLFTVRFH